MKKDKEMNWYDVTLFQFTKLQELVKIEDEDERMISIAELILGNDVSDLPLSEFAKELKKLKFLNEPIPEVKLPKKIELNGRKYYVDCLLGNISTSQYVDFNNHSKTNDMSKMLSVFFIPEGHKYNDGYDMLEVFNDMNDLPIPVVQSASFFFGRQYSTFMKIFRRYSIKQIKKTNLPKEAKENMIKVVEKSVDLALYPLS